MSKRYMSRPPYGFNGLPDYTTPPMTVEEYKACEAKYFDFLKPEETEIEQPVGAFSRLLRFIGMSKSTTIDGEYADDVQESSNKSQDGGDKEETVRTLPRTESRECGEKIDHTTMTDVAEAEIDVNFNTSSCRLRLLEKPNENDTIIDGDKKKPKKSAWKSLRKFFRRPFGRCLRTEE